MLDERILRTLVRGYFQPRENVWREPIHRNVWGLLTHFGNAERAGLIAPRSLVIEACAVPEVDGPPIARALAGHDNARAAEAYIGPDYRSREALVAAVFETGIPVRVDTVGATILRKMVRQQWAIVVC